MATNSNLSTIVRASPIEDRRIEGYLLLWGDANNVDLQNQYFTSETILDLEKLQTTLRFLDLFMLKGFAEAVFIGEVTNYRYDSFGVYIEGELKTSNALADQLVQEGLLFFAASSDPSSVAIDSNDGRIISYPIKSIYLTTSPC